MALAPTATDPEPIQHIVLYHLSTPEACSALIDFMLSLKLRLSKYVLDIKCGTVKPVEPIRNGGYNVVSIMTFRRDEDRAYFVKEDPAHKELLAVVGGKMEKGVMVVDFVDGDASTTFSS